MEINKNPNMTSGRGGADRRWIGRLVMIVGAVALVAATLSREEIFPTSWFSMLHGFTAPTTHAQSLADWTKRTHANVPTGAVDVRPPAPPVGDSSASTTPLPLMLTATRPGRNVHEGVADIETGDEGPQTYAAGAIMANGARLAEIYSDSVLLQKDGQSVRLYMHGRATEDAAVAKDAPALLMVGGTPAPAPSIAASHESLTDYIRPSPVYDGEQLRGIQVYAAEQSTVFDRLGLQAGDVITSIDGMPVRDQQASLEQLRRVIQGAAVTVQVQRGDEFKTISLDGAIARDAGQHEQRAPALAATESPPSL